MASRGILTPRCSSHPFQERTLILDQQVKIGRSVARAKPASNNAIFDCKVLSRNHALLWYDNGKFYLQDTKSSNGTFVNNKCLGKGAEESAPREVSSGDIVQFGVDVMENAGKVTHGCIIATLRLFFPDGKEAKASSSTVITQGESVSLEDLYVLNGYLQDALHRESQLEVKLNTLQRLLDDLHKSAEVGWRSLMTEDRLLTHIDSLEAQLQKYSKNVGEDNLKEELKKLQEDKDSYQEKAKASLQRVMEEKLDAVQKYENLEQAVKMAETQNISLKQMLDMCQVDLQELARKYSQELTKVEEMGVKLQATETSHKETCEQIEHQKRELKDALADQIEFAKHLQSNLTTVEGYLEVALQLLVEVQSDLTTIYAQGQTELSVESIRERINAAIAVAMGKVPRDSSDSTENQEKRNSEEKSVVLAGKIEDSEKFSSECEFIERADLSRDTRGEYDECKKEFDIDGDQNMPKNITISQEVFDTEKPVRYVYKTLVGTRHEEKDSEETQSFRKLQWEAQQSEKIVRNGIENASPVCDNTVLETEMQHLRTENSKLRQENLLLQQQFSVDLLEVQTLKSKNKHLSENIEELQSELVTLRERFSECNLERTRLSNSLREGKPGQDSHETLITQNRLFVPCLLLVIALLLGMWLKF